MSLIKKLIDYLLLFSEKVFWWNLVSLIISASISWLIGFNIIEINVDSLEIVSNLSLGLFGVNAAFITFFITLDKSPIFIKLKERYNHLYLSLLERFKANMLFSLLLNLIIFLILAFKESENIYINSLATLIFIYIFIQVIIGFVYLLDISSTLLTKKQDKEKVLD